ncbi:hypothetical protein TWF694_010683 [Orbilia ellipsospora]|uniref:Uncharacterized protein n=1 Tax=Orbilia ellipsospora TaxID=2528407 RepID=A0AAV9X6R8_9PEZI
MALPSPTSQPAYPHHQGPLIPSSVFSSDKDLQELVNRRDMRISSTHDLAEFLRSSRPEDYSRPAKPSDDLALEASQRKLSFKFLKTASKDFLSPRKVSSSVPVPVPSTVALPEKVRSKKTSKGNSYLAIQVDYTPARAEAFIPSDWTPSSSDDGNRNSITNTTAEFPSDRSNYRSSLVSQTWKEQDSNFHHDFENFSTSNTRVVSRWMRNSSGSELSSPRAALLPSPSSTSSIIKSDQDFPSIRNKYSHIGNPVNAISVVRNHSSNSSITQRRYSTDSTPRATPYPSRGPRICSRVAQSDVYGPIPSSRSSHTGGESPVSAASKPKDQDTNTPHTPAQPGPPPSRDLPSLPEGHGDAINLASKIRAAAAARSSVGSQISLMSDIGSLKSRRAGSSGRTRSEREISVKARKLKDLEEIRNRRGSSNIEPDLTSVKSKKSQSRSKKNHLKVENLGFSSITVVHEVAPDDYEPTTGNFDENETPSSISQPGARTSTSSAASSEALPLTDRPSMDEASESFSSAKVGETTKPPTIVDVNHTATLEARVKNMERRNHLLEQALLAVLRSAISIDSGAGTGNEGPSLSEIFKCLSNASP